MSFRDLWQAILAAFGKHFPALRPRAVAPQSPPEIRMYSSLGGLWYPDYDRLCAELARNGWNALGLPLFGCTKKADGVEDVIGYWNYASLNRDTPEMAWFWAQWGKAVAACVKHNTAPVVGLMSDNFPGMANQEFWKADYHDWLIERVRTLLAPCAGNAWICPVNELGWSKDARRIAVLKGFCQRVEAAKVLPASRLLWNGFAPAGPCPAGWSQEYHPQKATDFGPPGCLIYNDAPLNVAITNGQSLLPAAEAYYRSVRQAGRGYGIFLYDFTPNVDWGGIRLLSNVNTGL